MSHPEIIPIEYGRSTLPEDQIFINGTADKSRPIVFLVYLIKADNRLILIDAGCVTMPDFDMKDFIGPVKALENIGISADDITDVAITHSHHDHAECANCFKNAAVYIQTDEYESGKRYFTDIKNLKLFDECVSICDGVKMIKIGGHSKGSCIVEISSEKSTHIIAGDECYLYECLEKHIPTGASFCPEKSRRFIEKYSSDKYHVLLCHDKK